MMLLPAVKLVGYDVEELSVIILTTCYTYEQYVFPIIV